MTEVNLGGHPMWNLLKMIVLALLLTTIISAGAYLIAKPLGGIVMIIALLLWSLAAFRFPGALIGGLINSRNYNAAKKLVAEGGLSISYIGRNLNCVGLAVVDDQYRRLYLNGRLYDFADVKSIGRNETAAKPYVEIVVKHGETPMKKVWFDSETETTTFYHRLRNSLGFA